MSRSSSVTSFNCPLPSSDPPGIKDTRPATVPQEAATIADHASGISSRPGTIVSIPVSECAENS